MKTYDDLNGKVAIVTGASSGIGKATALALAESGVRLVINYHHNEAGARAAADAVRKRGGAAETVQADVRSARECARLADAARDRFGPVDILVNNAGGLDGRQLISDITEQDWDDVFALNLKSAFLCTQAVAPMMMDRRSGVIVNVASVAGRTGGTLPGAAHYCAAKGGMIAFSKNLAREMAAYGVRVNTVNPGVVESPFHKNGLAPEIVKQLSAAIPLRRLGTVEDIAKVIVFLCSSDAAYLCGETIEVNGGMLML